MLAHVVANPVLEHVRAEPVRGVVRGRVDTAAYVDLAGFVVAITARGVPLMPNAIALGERPGRGRWPVPGTRVTLRPGRLELGPRPPVVWDARRPPAWDPSPPAPGPVPGTAIAARGRALLGARGIPVEASPATLAAGFGHGGLSVPAQAAGRNGTALLLRSIVDRDAEMAARAASLLIGLGGGLTPEGDDLLAGAAVAVAVLGQAVGFPAAARAAWLAALRPANLRRLTTPLSATLLDLATRGRVVEPVHGLLDLTPEGKARWPGALRRLERIGHSTGPAYIAATGATALLLAA